MRRSRGSVEDQICRGHVANSTYTLDFSFPVGYPDEQALTDYLEQTRDGFINVAEMPDSRGLPYELDAAGTSYRSGVAPNGTQSVVFKIFQDVGGVHPQTWYKAFNYDLGKGAPISYDTLFKPGSEPLDVIFPVVQRELQKQTGLSDPILPGDGLDPANYQNFALTDDALIFSSVRASCLPKRRGRRGLGAAGDRRADPRVGRARSPRNSCTRVRGAGAAACRLIRARTRTPVRRWWRSPPAGRGRPTPRPATPSPPAADSC